MGGLNATTCERRCGSDATCDAYELTRRVDSGEPPGEVVACWHFRTGGFRLLPGCDTTSGRMECFGV
eukprot:1960550-Prymnesium_polylepis.1